jgi:eukaryotic-like serine/threonine-protein kinase
MERDLAAWLSTHAELRDTAAGTTITPREDPDLQRALAFLEQMASAPALGSVQLRAGEVIGAGGMGVVREAEQVALGRTVAIKTLRHGKRDAQAASDLLREAWVTGSLEHPNIVPVHHLGLADDGTPVLVLKRIEGVEWSKLMRDGAEVKRRFGATDLLAWNLSILLQALNAIRFAHSRGILHRDLKPANVMIGDFGEVYVLDWGLAVSLREDDHGRLPLARNAKSIAGTPCYMAPEMVAPGGDVPLSERTDVYLAGAVLFDIVAGRPPHEGKSALEVMSSVISSRPVPPDDVAPELAELITKALAHDPADRFESAEALRLALQSYLEHRGSDQLVARARARLDELAAILASPPSAGREGSPEWMLDRERHREAVYRLFGACRFGFHEALAAWHGNTAARAGLRRATVAVAEYELATGDAQTAVTLLSELDEPPALLEQARQAATRQADRREQLERLGYAHDLAVGRPERGRIATTLGAFFTVVPILSVVVPGFSVVSYWFQGIISIFFALLTGAWTYLLREKLGTTLVNRRLIGGLMFMFGAQALLVLGAWLIDVPVVYTQVFMLFLYFVMAGVTSMTVDVALLPTALFYGGAFIYGAWRPEHRMFAMAAGNLTFTLNVAYAWRKRTTR